MLGLILLQVLVLRQIVIGPPGLARVTAMVYPLFIMLLPMRVPREALMILGFFLGLIVDIFYDSPGVHASATVLLAFLRPTILRLIEPRGDYKTNQNPNIRNYGTGWFVQYALLLLFAHHLMYFSMEIFTPVYFWTILWKTLLALGLSFIFIMAIMLITNPTD